MQALLRRLRQERRRRGAEALRWLDVGWTPETDDGRGVVRGHTELASPFRTRKTGAWHVSAEASTIKKWNLALRPNKTAKRYIVDGGI